VPEAEEELGGSREEFRRWVEVVEGFRNGDCDPGRDEEGGIPCMVRLRSVSLVHLNGDL
jgi:hypothetical protein